MSLYGDAINAFRQVILLDERVRGTVADVARLTQEVGDLRDRVSRLEGMLAVALERSSQPVPEPRHRTLPKPPPERTD